MASLTHTLVCWTLCTVDDDEDRDKGFSDLTLLYAFNLNFLYYVVCHILLHSAFIYFHVESCNFLKMSPCASKSYKICMMKDPE
jgi:hypothetical protein